MEPQDGFLRSSRSSAGAFHRSGMLIKYFKHVQEMQDSSIFVRPGPLVPFQRVINGYPGMLWFSARGGSLLHLLLVDDAQGVAFSTRQAPLNPSVLFSCRTSTSPGSCPILQSKAN